MLNTVFREFGSKIPLPLKIKVRTDNFQVSDLITVDGNSYKVMRRIHEIHDAYHSSLIIELLIL